MLGCNTYLLMPLSTQIFTVCDTTSKLNSLLVFCKLFCLTPYSGVRMHFGFLYQKDENSERGQGLE